jgi:hypothetical protein|tara:strand:- start:2020 stop:2385 length:366 start_codon:yes stop_codon:yes gene_type:complete
MGAAGIEIPDWINDTTVERSFRRMNTARHCRQQNFADKGMRAARARDSRLLKALEGGAEVLSSIQERQRGRTIRDTSTPYGHRVDLTEYSMWREAYRMCDEKTPDPAFEWIYGAAAELAGL